MTAPLTQREVEILLIRAIEASPEERATVLQGLADRCPIDIEKLKTLLEEDSSVESSQDATSAGLDSQSETIASPDPETSSIPPSSVGPYRIQKRLGGGGMGVVYLAKQDKPVRREVALKIMKPGAGSDELLSRFEAERQVLALMEHPNIAKVYDAGRTEQGMPYFAMELVRGAEITNYLLKKALSTTATIQVFLNVCKAVQHAHNKGVIHRDLKPGNIMVVEIDRLPVVKVIDFGIAKAAVGTTDRDELMTQQGQLIGTLEYMSPEQVLGRVSEIDTRTDVYALGIVLYQVLSGSLPFASSELRDRSLTDAQRVIVEKEPKRPSVTAGLVGGAGQQSKRAREIRGDLDWIILKAIEKDKERRYRSVNELADDLERYLKNQPIQASPPSPFYRARKFIRRNRAMVGVVSAIAVSILGVLFETNRQRIIALEAKDEAVAVTRFLSDMLAAVDPETQGKNVKVRDILDESSAAIQDRFADQPLVQAQLMSTMGVSYHQLGELQEAEPLLQRALDLRSRSLPGNHPDIAFALNNLAVLRDDTGDLDGAESLYARALAIRERSGDGDDADVANSLNNLGLLKIKRGEYVEAEELLQRSHEIKAVLFGEHSAEVATAHDNLGNLRRLKGDYTEAKRHMQTALDIRRQVFGDKHPKVGRGLFNLGSLAHEMGDVQGARHDLSAALAIQAAVQGRSHPEYARSLHGLANVARDLGEMTKAESLYTDALSAFREAQGEEGSAVAGILNDWGILATRLGDLDAAEARYKSVLAIRRAALGDEHPEVAGTMSNLADVFVLKGDTEHAELYFQECLRIYRDLYGEDHVNVGSVLNNLGDLCRAAGRFDESRKHYTAAYQVWEALFAGTHPYKGITIHNLAVLDRETGNYRESEERFREAHKIFVERLGESHPLVSENRTQFDELARVQGRSLASLNPELERP